MVIVIYVKIISILANDASVIAAGASCTGFYTEPPSSLCDASSLCLVCPEYWSNTNIAGTCRSLKFPTTTSSSSNCNCGYKATCKTIGGADICTCPAGYQLHSNGKDCYGWKTDQVGSCSVSCGIGTQTVTQTCDAPTSLESPCSESSKITIQDCSKDRCQCKSF